MDSHPVEFEGRPLPPDEAMPAVLAGSVADRAWLVRAAVCRAEVARTLETWALGEALGGPPEALGLALSVARALGLRRVARAVVESWAQASGRYLGVADAWSPGRTLAQTAFTLVRETRLPGDPPTEAFLRAALAHDELRVEGFHTMIGEDGAVLLPHLRAVLEAQPALAAVAGTQYALRHRSHAEAACRALHGAPKELRAAFGEALLRHLDRVHAIKLKVACRRLLA